MSLRTAWLAFCSTTNSIERWRKSIRQSGRSRRACCSSGGNSEEIMDLERRFCAQHGLRLDRRAEDSLPMIAGYAAVFNTLSVDLWGFREKIAPGAFAGSLQDDVRALWNHETGIVLGRTKSGTLRLAEDDVGLAIEIDPPSSAGNYIETIERGDVDQMSFAFRTLEQTWDEDAPPVPLSCRRGGTCRSCLWGYS
ncbi:MAG: HK97 family phage prohead protease [Chloroflexi bacterium]|nr:MAG: HK97 family phage prohead protease [Chloroflexota bacterium]